MDYSGNLEQDIREIKELFGNMKLPYTVAALETFKEAEVERWPLNSGCIRLFQAVISTGANTRRILPLLIFSFLYQ